MKEAAIFTMGTRGDIQPYIYLTKALEQAGIHAAIGTHPCWRNLVEASGVAFSPVGPDVDIEKEAAVIRGKTKNPAISMLRTMKFVFGIIQNSSGDILRVCEGKDLVVISHSQMGAVEAEALGIPTVNVTLQLEMIPEKLKKQTFSDKLIGNLINSQMVKPYNKIRKGYHLPRIKSVDEIMSKDLDLVPVSRYVVEKNPYWEEQHKLTGYWYLEEKEYRPDERLLRFLDAGEKPVILSLGAMSFEEQKESEKLDCFVRAFQKTGMRAMIQGFQKTLADYPLPDTMISIGSVPHSWLFRQGCLVIHHCGFGTASASLIYGIPSIPVPHVLDQFGFAAQLYELGVSSEPLKAGELNENKIAAAIEDMKKHYESRKSSVSELSVKLREENGLQTAAELIGQVLAKKSS